MTFVTFGICIHTTKFTLEHCTFYNEWYKRIEKWYKIGTVHENCCEGQHNKTELQTWRQLNYDKLQITNCKYHRSASWQGKKHVSFNFHQLLSSNLCLWLTTFTFSLLDSSLRPFIVSKTKIIFHSAVTVLLLTVSSAKES